MRVIYSGFDKLDVAFKGALSIESLCALRNAREDAYRRGEESLAEMGPGKVPMHIRGHGMRGGYAFITNSGPLGETWFFKDSSDPQEWNIFVSVGSLALAVGGYETAKRQIFQRIEEIGGRVTEESLNRADYAVDVLAPGFVLAPECLVSHSHSKVSLYWGEKGSIERKEHVGAVFRGRRLESITVGKMPGRQVIIYDKRKEAIEKSKPHWFKVWRGRPDDPGFQVWRVEVRAGKKELKDKWQIRSFNDFENSIGDTFNHILSKVRYVDQSDSDSNISRRAKHPLWLEVTKHLDRNLLAHRSGLTPDQFRLIERDRAISNYRIQMLAHAAGLSVALGLDDGGLETDFPDFVRNEIISALNDPSLCFHKTVQRARARLKFIAPPVCQTEEGC